MTGMSTQGDCPMENDQEDASEYIVSGKGLYVTIVKRDLDSEVEDDVHHVLTGGDMSNPTWEEYLERFNEDVVPRVILIRKAIEDYGWVGEKASSFCNRHQFRFNDGMTVGFTWRAWGDLMQAIVGKREGFMAYYQ